MCIQRAKGLFNTKRGSRLPVGVDTTRSFLSVLVQMTGWRARIILTTLFLFIFCFHSLCFCSFFFFFFFFFFFCSWDYLVLGILYQRYISIQPTAVGLRICFGNPSRRCESKKLSINKFQGSMLAVLELESRQGCKNPNQGELPVTSLVTRSKHSQRSRTYLQYSLKARPCANTAHLPSKCNVCKKYWEQKNKKNL